MKEVLRLNNGLKVVISQMPHMESVAIGVWIGMGGRYEEEEHQGMTIRSIGGRVRDLPNSWSNMGPTSTLWTACCSTRAAETCCAAKT